MVPRDSLTEKFRPDPGPPISVAEPFGRDNETYRQAFGFPVAQNLAAELTPHRRFGEKGSEPFAVDFAIDRGATAFSPDEDKIVSLLGAGDIDAALGYRQRAIFRSVCCKLIG
jgi:hypothetical protein